MLARLSTVLLIALPLFPQGAPLPQGALEDRDITTAVQQLFNTMTARDAAAARAVCIPSAPFIFIRNGKVTVSNSEDFATRLAAAPEPWN
jgi:hypothetical protein